MSVKTMLKRKFMDFAKDESGMGTVEVLSEHLYTEHNNTPTPLFYRNTSEIAVLYPKSSPDT